MEFSERRAVVHDPVPTGICIQTSQCLSAQVTFAAAVTRSDDTAEAAPSSRCMDAHVIDEASAEHRSFT